MPTLDPADALEDPQHVRVNTERSPEKTTLDLLKALIRLNDRDA